MDQEVDAAAEQRLLSFPQALPGFPGVTAYRLEALDGHPRFLLMRSAVEGGPAFLLTPHVGDDHLLDQADVAAACEAVGLDPAEVAVFFVVTARRVQDELQLYLNRRAPVLIEPVRRLGYQIVLPRADYAIRHALAA